VQWRGWTAHDSRCYIVRHPGRRNGPFAPCGDGCIAQLVEQLTLNQRVEGSSPSTPTNEIKTLAILQSADLAAPGTFPVQGADWV
jgi:hypothetical protein